MNKPKKKPAELDNTHRFLLDLTDNNNREWFQTNKERYEAARAEFSGFLEHLIAEIEHFDPDIRGVKAKDCLFRIYRDIRFSKDKRPYKENFGAFISPGGRKAGQPGYYLHFEPDAHFLAGGKHMPTPAEAAAVRRAIALHRKPFLNIVNEDLFRSLFGGMGGDSLKRLPRGFEDADEEIAVYLKLKTFTVSHRLEGDLNAELAAESFRVMSPLILFLREALEG